MRLGVDFSILNQKGTPAFYSDIFANRPAAGFAGRVFISTDTGAIYEDTGSAWTLIADAGAGTTGTLQQVTTNGNTTAQGIVVTAGNVAIGTATAGAPLDVHFSTNIGIQINNTATGNSNIAFQNQDIGKWRIGNVYNGGANSFDVYNNTLLTTALSFNATNNAATFNNSVTATSLITSGGTSAQFVKGNGSLDSGTYLPITGGISTDQILKVYSSGGNFYLGSSTISDNGTSVTINGRITSNSDTISVNGTAGGIQMQINNQTATTGKQWYLNSKSTGILGIGNNTASDVLTFASTGIATFLQGIQSTGTADQMLQIYGSSPSLRLYNTITSPTITGFVGMATATNNFILGSASGDMCIGTSTAGKIYIGSGTTTVSPAITATSAGLLGFGTTIPNMRLSVIGDGTYTSGDINVAEFVDQISGSGKRGVLLGYYANGSSATAGVIRVPNNGDLLINGNGGSVGIGTNSPAYTLEIDANTTNFVSMIKNTSNSFGNGLYIYSPNNTSSSTNEGFLRAESGAGVKAYIYTNGSFGSATGTYGSIVSDIRLKENINNATSKLNDLLKLRVVNFNIIEDLDKIKQIGFIAQELKEVFPSLVYQRDTREYYENGNIKKGLEDALGLKVGMEFAILVKAIQELNEKIEKLQNN